MALRLHFDDNMISQIRTESQNNEFHACQSVFSKWLDGKKGLRQPRTWGTVIDILKEADLCQLAEDLEQVLRGKYGYSIQLQLLHTPSLNSMILSICPWYGYLMRPLFYCIEY